MPWRCSGFLEAGCRWRPRWRRALDAPLDVIVVRKLGVPDHSEFAMGAIGERGVRVLSGDVIRSAGVTDEQLADVEVEERRELERRAQRYRGERPAVELVGRTALIVDDGIATGSTALAASGGRQIARRSGGGDRGARGTGRVGPWSSGATSTR